MHDYSNKSAHVAVVSIVAALLWLGGSKRLAAQIELPPEVIAAEHQRIEVIDRISPTVVAIFPPDGQGGGSGVLISPDGLTLTNFHVVDGAGPFLKCGLNDGKIYDAVLMGIDPTGDVAMIQLLGRDDFPFARLGNSDTVKVGDWALAMGNPFLLAEDFQPTLTFGMVSGVQRYQYPAGTFLEYTDCIQVDTSINPGNSGGPLFNEQGEVVGINGRISVEKRGRVNAGAGYAISINQIKNFRDHLQSGRVVDHATLGATVRSDEFSTVIVDTILETSSAYFCGLRRGDEIISFGGRPIGSVNQLKNVLGIYPKGWKIPLVYRRDGERFEIFPRLEALHSTGELLEFAGEPPMPANPEEEPKEEMPIPLPLPHGKKPIVIPEEHKHLYTGRLGFVNYHFNQTRQDKLLNGLKSLGDFGGPDRKWTFTGQIAGGAEFKLVLAEFACLLELPQEQRAFLMDLGRPETFVAGLNSEGMLMALYEWQQFMTKGKGAFTEMYYVGSEPLDGVGQRVDVLFTLDSEREIRWYFDQGAGQLVGWDLRLRPDMPECGIRIPTWKPDQPHSTPVQFSVVVDGKPATVFEVNSMKTGDVEKPTP